MPCATMPRGHKDPNCPNCQGRSFPPDGGLPEDYMICRICEEPESEFIDWYKGRWPEAYAKWEGRNAQRRVWADHERLAPSIILTWRNGAYYVSEPNFLGEGESVRLLVSAPPIQVEQDYDCACEVECGDVPEDEDKPNAECKGLKGS